jgi:hypothetical protein
MNFCKKDIIRAEFEAILRDSTDCKLNRKVDGDYCDKYVKETWLDFLNARYLEEINKLKTHSITWGATGEGMGPRNHRRT